MPPVETAADRAALLDPEEFGARVIVTPAAGDPVVFDAQFEADGIDVELADGVRVRTSKPTLFARASDVAGLVEGAVEIEGVDVVYEIGDPPQPDGTGFAVLELKRSW